MDDIPAERASPRAAHEDLQYIRQTLAAAGHLSTVPGKGMVVIGLLATGATFVNLWITGAPWDVVPLNLRGVAVWLVLLAMSLGIGAAAMAQKARRTRKAFWSPVLRKALWGYLSAMLLGGVLSVSMVLHGRADSLAEVWLGSYGVGLMAAGAISVSPVRWMGICFLVLAVLAVFASPAAGLALLGLGFGWLHLAFGAYIAWKHDG